MYSDLIDEIKRDAFSLLIITIETQQRQIYFVIENQTFI